MHTMVRGISVALIFIWTHTAGGAERPTNDAGPTPGRRDGGLFRHSNAHNQDRVIRYLECRAGIHPGCPKPQPFHQLQRPVKVAMCPNNHDHAFDNIIRNGLKAHPMVELIHSDREAEADYIFFISERHDEMRDEEEGRVCPGPFPNRTVVLDETDTPGHLAVPSQWITHRETDYRTHWNQVAVLDYLAAFKRSFVEKDTSQYDKQMLGFRVITPTERPSYFPIQYAIVANMIPDAFPSWESRKLSMSTVLRPDFYQDGTKKDGARAMTQKWMQEYAETHNITNFHRGAPSDGGRGEAEGTYFGILRGSKILVTCNPSFWEGDHRTGEALVGGGMVMVDYMWSPRPFPLVDNWHVVYFDPTDKEDFMRKLHYYYTHEDEARVIAARGTYHVQRYMTPLTTVDYVLCTVEQLLGRGDDYIRTGPQILKDFNNLYSLQQKELYPFRRRD